LKGIYALPETLDASQYELPAGVVFDAVVLDGEAAERPQLLEQLRDRISTSRVFQEEWTRRFDSLYDEAVRRNFSSPFLIQWAGALFEKGRAASERLYPLVEAMQQKLSADSERLDAESLELFQAAIALAVGWITPYSKLCDRLLDLASQRRLGESTVLHARPVAGDIDHGALSREFMARFPKIRASLAK
jgi:hypothetical protein